MSSPHPIPVQVVFDASRRRRRGSGGHVGHTSRGASRKPMLVLGTLNALVAASLYYGIWWQVDRLIYMTFMWKTPVITEESGIDLETAAAQMFGIRSAPRSQPVVEPPDETASQWSGTASQKVIGATAYAWLTLATVGCCALALAAGAALAAGFSTSSMKRTGGLALAILTAAGLAYGSYATWTKYGTGYPANHLRWGMAGLVLFCVSLGFALNPKTQGLRRVLRFASYTIILSAVASTLGAYLWRQAGALEPQHTTPAMLGLIFGIHSLWGWVLLIVSIRI